MLAAAAANDKNEDYSPGLSPDAARSRGGAVPDETLADTDEVEPTPDQSTPGTESPSAAGGRVRRSFQFAAKGLEIPEKNGGPIPFPNYIPYVLVQYRANGSTAGWSQAVMVEVCVACSGVSEISFCPYLHFSAPVSPGICVFRIAQAQTSSTRNRHGTWQAPETRGNCCERAKEGKEWGER
jgi:hypothetical protein